MSKPPYRMPTEDADMCDIRDRTATLYPHPIRCPFAWLPVRVVRQTMVGPMRASMTVGGLHPQLVPDGWVWLTRYSVYMTVGGCDAYVRLRTREAARP